MEPKKKKIISLILIIFFIGTGIGLFYLLPNPLKKGWSGAILFDTTWGPGEITVSGDIIVVPGVTLTILPGTTIKVLADESDLNLVYMSDSDVDLFTKGDPTADPAAGGNNFQKTHTSIIVKGKIRSLGTEEKPIIFTSSRAIDDGKTPFYTDWWGLNAKNGEFTYTIITWCIDPLYSSNGYEKLTLDHCYIGHSWAAAVGWMEPVDGAQTGNAYVKHSTIVDYGHEAIDMHSSGHVELAYNNISSGQVGLNFHDDIDADGNHLTVNAHHNLILNSSFPILATDGAVVDLTHNLLESEPISTEHWNYKGYTMKSVLQEGTDASILCPPGDFDAANTIVNVYNNIFYKSGIGIRKDSDVITVNTDYNNYDQCNIATTGIDFTVGPHSLTMDSQFIDPNTNNFHLQQTSPLIDSGVTTNASESDQNPNIGLYGGANALNDIGWYPNLAAEYWKVY